MTQYWVIRGSERHGPYEEGDVLEGFALGKMGPSDLLWVEGMREGVPIADSLVILVIALVLGFVLGVVIMIGYLVQPFTPRKRALHDYIPGTVVVVQGYYSRALVVTIVLLLLGGPIILGLLFGAGLKMLEILGR